MQKTLTVRRALGATAALFIVAYIFIYTAVASDPNLAAGVAWWYVAVLVVAAVLALGYVLIPTLTPLVWICVGLTAISMFLGIMTVGILLLPAVAASLTAATLGRGKTQRLGQQV